mgnify:CR=1 FL=1
MSEDIEYESLEERIVDYCLEEGILQKRLPENDKVKWGYNIEFPPKNPKPRKMSVIQPAGRKFIVIQLGTQISEEHLKMLKKSKKPNANLVYFEVVKRMLLSRNLLFHIDAKNNRFMISDQIYKDAITMDFFYRTIRKVFNAGLLSNLLLIDLIKGNLRTKDSARSEPTSSGFSDKNLFFS